MLSPLKKQKKTSDELLTFVNFVCCSWGEFFLRSLSSMLSKLPCDINSKRRCGSSFCCFESPKHLTIFSCLSDIDVFASLQKLATASSCPSAPILGALIATSMIEPSDDVIEPVMSQIRLESTLTQDYQFESDGWLWTLRFKYKPGYRSCDLLKKTSALIGGKFIFSKKKKKSFTKFALRSECCNFNQWEEWIYGRSCDL